MKILNQKIATIFAIVLLFASLLVFSVPKQAAAADASQPFSGPLPDGVTADVTADSIAALSFRPNPIGLGQTFLVNFWVAPAPKPFPWNICVFASCP